jgi:hypothetical protein
MTHVTLRQWTDVVRRARLGRTVKAVAMVLATYADADGTRVYPGVARLSYECEMNYNTVKAALKTLRDAGLIVKVGRRGDADVYRLILAADLADRCDVPTPAQVELELNALRGLKRGSYVPRQKDTEAENLRPVPLAADETAPENLRPVSRAADCGICGQSHRPQEKSAACFTNNLRPVPLAATTHDRVTEETTHSDTDLRTASHPPRGDAAESNSDFSAEVIDLDARRASLSAPRCIHGLQGGNRTDGKPNCTVCRNVAHLVEAIIPNPRGAPA